MTDQAKCLWEGGLTRRLHTVLHLQHYDVAQHSWRMAALLFALHPNPSQKLLWAVLFHDVPERWVGDMPAPAKWNGLGDALEKAEHKIAKKLDIDFDLEWEEVLWLKGLDILELFLFCEDEVRLGNLHLVEVRRRCMEFLGNNSIPDEILGFMETYDWNESTTEGMLNDEDVS